MNFNQLRYVLAVDAFQSFAKAADHCGIAQSTISKEIQRLEGEFGVLIFDRSRHPVVPTMKGKDLLEQARKIVAELEAFQDIARQKNNPAEGAFALGILPALAPYLLPVFVKEVEAKYPALQLSISECGLRQMELQLSQESLDGGIVIAPFFKEGYYETPLFRESFVLYIHPDHPLATQALIRWADIPQAELLLHEDLREGLLHAKELVTHHVTFQSGSLETIRKIVERNGGMTLLPEMACQYMGERRQRFVRPIDGGFIQTISLVTPRGFQKNRLSKVIILEIQEAVRRKR